MTGLIAVTGATGFLGRHALEALKAAGWTPRILVRRTVDTNAEPFAGAQQVVGDLFDGAALGRLVADTDAVLHLAGVVKAARAHAYRVTNTEGTERLVRAWQENAPGARLVFASSMAAREPALSEYARSKADAEQCLRDLEDRVDWRIIRPCAVYGPGDRETLSVFRLADSAMQPMLNAADARVCLVHARDVAEAIVATLEDPQSQTVREVTDARVDGYRWDELVSAAAHALARTPKPYRVPTSVLQAIGGFGGLFTGVTGRPALLSPGKVREILHADWSSRIDLQVPSDIWKPQIRLEDGFDEAIGWYRKQGWLKSPRGGQPRTSVNEYRPAG